MENDSYDQWIEDNKELHKEIPELLTQQVSVREYSEHKETEVDELSNAVRLAFKDKTIFWNNYIKPLYDINVRYKEVNPDLTDEQQALLLSREHSIEHVERWEKHFQEVRHEVANRVEVLTKLSEDLDLYKAGKGRIDMEYPMYQVASMICSLQWLIQQKILTLRSSLLNKKRMSRKNEFFECSKIEACIGIGGFGIVFHTRGAIDERSYAAKVFNSKANKNKDVIEVELDAISKLRHPRIANFHYFGIDDRIPKNEDMLKMVKEYKDKNKPKSTELSTMFFVMDFYEDTLASWFKANPTKQQRSLPKMKKWLYQLCEGLYEIHRNKMIHRDIKPDNIFMHNDDLLIGDLGLATIFRTETEAEGSYDSDSSGDIVFQSAVNHGDDVELTTWSTSDEALVNDAIGSHSKSTIGSADTKTTRESYDSDSSGGIVFANDDGGNGNPSKLIESSINSKSDSTSENDGVSSDSQLTVYSTDTETTKESYDSGSSGGIVFENNDGGNVNPNEVKEWSISSKFTSKSVDDVISSSSKSAMSSTDVRATEENGADIKKLTKPVKYKHTVGAGTPWYKAPEQDESHGRYGPKVDVYALGKVYFEMLVPNSTTTGRNMDFNKLEKDGICPDIADDEKKMILKLTQRKEADRPDITELIEDPYFDDIKNAGPSASTASERWDDFAYGLKYNPDGSVTKTKIPIDVYKEWLKNKHDNN